MTTSEALRLDVLRHPFRRHQRRIALGPARAEERLCGTRPAAHLRGRARDARGTDTVARELHDGLAQDLWFAKLKHERLVPYVPDDQKELAQEVTQALDSAISEAKQAVVTMRAADDRDRPLEELMSRTIEDFAARSGVRADFSAADLPDALPVRTQVELLRMLQEALTNVRKHADATVVRIGRGGA